ncbi:importin-n-terminal domain-containing protein [Stylonychia lemnae]|uniref:Importin-n-terminal domain-containing protein n=1 Tax=Stylonychia lemnae TaxID=5949 RepID=A0A078A4G8_STYLE|nr:importin-n-terminal domain-containing protein [Stylonychia lemnae]|eukprot:CDW76789.1 importin-n-terminal domain-containing protein [Stylonychia lemnae]
MNQHPQQAENQQIYQNAVLELPEFEQLCNILYGSQSNHDAKQQADLKLKSFTESIESIPRLKHFLEVSNNEFSQYLSASALKNLLGDNWLKIPLEEKVAIKEYLLNFLANKALKCNRQVMKMMIILLAKISKLSWFDHPELQNVMSPEHILIGLLTIDQMVLEMTYINKGKNLTINRRVSLNFRDSALFQIFKQALVLNKQLIEQIQTQTDQNQQVNGVLAECLKTNLEICHKCLIFDYTSVLLNETLDEPTNTNVPNSWREFIETKQNVDVMFYILKANIPSPFCSAIKSAASMCLAEYANIRQSIFEKTESRIEYVQNFVNNLIHLFQSPAKHFYILKDRLIFKEFVKIPHKFEINFQIRDLTKIGDAILEGYLQELFNFTIESYKTPSASVKFHSSVLNQVWQRILQESMQMNISSQNKIEEIIDQIIAIFLEENLKQEGMAGNTNVDEDEEDEDENFDKKEKTIKNDNLDFFSRLMKQKIDTSLNLMINYYNQIIQQYQNALGQNQKNFIKSCERQLGYLVKVTNSLFSYGMPSANSRVSLLAKQNQNDMNADSATPTEIKYPDFVVCSRQNNQRKVYPALETSLLQFGITYKAQVLGDPRMLLIGIQHNPTTDSDDFYEKMENDSSRSFNSIAQMMDQTDMMAIMDIFAEKILQNLIYTDGNTDEGKEIIGFTLDFFDVFVSSPSSCRLLSKSSIIKQLIQNHVMQFNVLQNDPNQKHIGQFFKILSILWLHEDYIDNFETYISQLNTIITEIFSLDPQIMITNQNVRSQLIKLFYILKGIVNALSSSRHFGLFFDWFYPENFTIIGKALSAFINDDEVVLVIFKFLAEIVNNRCSRLRFDTWNINGLIVFKEAAKITIQYLQLCDNLNQKIVKRDAYKEKYKFLMSIMNIYVNCITGHYISFAICEFYNDDTFSQLSICVMKCLTSINIKDIKAYDQIYKKVFSLLESFFRNHLELMFAKFDFQLIENILQISVTVCLDYFNEYVYNNLKKPSKKSPQLAANIQNFYQTQNWVFQTFMKSLAFTLLFEEHKNIWVYQKCFHSTIIMCEATAKPIIFETIMNEEKSEDRKQKLGQEVEILFTGMSPGLDSRARESFNPKFTALKTFLVEYVL